ncbi:MAG: GTPase Era [Pseudomonadota bacterium]|nr:GTPase Era [Pseudomonadota bacterium]
MTEGVEQKCGFVAILGAPNAGKSTLLNALVGNKVSIVSPKPQTTRSRVLGILIEGGSQIILVDTPGIFRPRRRLDRAMVSAAWQGAADADQTMLLVDASQKNAVADAQPLLERLEKAGRKAVLVLNKIDLVPKGRLLELTAALNRTGLFTDTLMISALTGDGIGQLKQYLAQRMRPGPWLFPEDQISDMPMRLLAAEVTREKLFLQLHEELPYAMMVETETWEEQDNGSVRIGQIICVTRDNHRAIVLGQGGQRIKAIGIAARKELEQILERPVHLALHVKVRKDWMEKSAWYVAWGLDFNAQE